MPDMFIILGIYFFITNGRAFMTFDIHEKNKDKKVNSVIYEKNRDIFCQEWMGNGKFM